MVTVDFLSWSVFDHFTRRTAPSPDVRKSPLAKCLVLSKVATECGKILDSLRKEKKHVRYNALKIVEYGTLSQYMSNDCNFWISTMGLMVGSKGALIFSAFKYR